MSFVNITNTTCASASMSGGAVAAITLLTMLLYLVAFFVMSAAVGHTPRSASLNDWKQQCTAFYDFISDILNSLCFCLRFSGGGGENDGLPTVGRNSRAGAFSRVRRPAGAAGGLAMAENDDATTGGGDGGGTDNSPHAGAMDGSGGAGGAGGGGSATLAPGNHRGKLRQSAASLRAGFQPLATTDEATSHY